MEIPTRLQFQELVNPDLCIPAISYVIGHVVPTADNPDPLRGSCGVARRWHCDPGSKIADDDLCGISGATHEHILGSYVAMEETLRVEVAHAVKKLREN